MMLSSFDNIIPRDIHVQLNLRNTLHHEWNSASEHHVIHLFSCNASSLQIVYNISRTSRHKVGLDLVSLFHFVVFFFP